TRAGRFHLGLIRHGGGCVSSRRGVSCVPEVRRPPMLRRWLILLLALTAPLAAWAEDALQPADPAAIRQVIQGQMDAFRSDDWSAAFAYAAPGIQAKFVSPEIFRQMVTGAYQPVYRPKGVEFRALEASE